MKNSAITDLIRQPTRSSSRSFSRTLKARMLTFFASQHFETGFSVLGKG
jgi:hypothetical protein